MVMMLVANQTHRLGYVRYAFIPLYQVKVKVKVALERATRAQRGSRGIVLLFL